MKTVNLALRNLTRNKRRNAILAIAIAFGFFVVTAIEGLTTGMVGNLENQITQLIGGNVLIRGVEYIKPSTPGGKASTANIMRNKNYIKNIVDESKIPYEYCSLFTDSYGSIIFSGKKNTILLYGRDLKDKRLNDSFQFVSGGINTDIKNGIIISDKTASALNLQVGDNILYSTTTVYGQNTFADMTVTGILKSSGFFSTIQSYADIEDVNELLEMPAGGYSLFSVYLKNKKQQTLLANFIEERISKDHESNPDVSVTSRAEAMRTNPKNISAGLRKQVNPNKKYEWQGVKYMSTTFYDQVPQIETVLNIVHIITTVILIVILLIVMVGVSNTYRMVLYERIREIGTMRALGMSGKDTRRIFTNEAVILCIIGAIAGLIIATIVMTIVHFIPIANESLSFFLKKGHFTFKLSIVSIIIQYLILIILTTFAVRGSAKQAAKMNPAEALRTVK